MAMTEVGVGAVQLIPSMRGFGSTATRELKAGLSRPAREAGKDAGKRLSKGVESGVDKSTFSSSGKEAGRSFSDGVESGVDKVGDSMESAGSTAGDLFASGFDPSALADKAVEAFSGLSGKFGKAAAGAGMAAGGALAVGVMSGFEVEASTDRLAAQLGGGKWAEGMGDIAGRLYGQGFGESVAETGAAIRRTLQSGLLPEDATDEQIQRMTTRVLTFSDVMEQDLDMATQAVSNMIRTGIAEDGRQAFDVLTAGVQQGADRAGDLLETFQEYSVQFAQIGLSAEEATGLMSQGLQAGARDSDVVADALKEFAIRAQDGSDATREAFATLGMSADRAMQQVAEGGPGARRVLGQVLDRFRTMPEGVGKSTAAFDLFGSKSEDVQMALDALDLDTAASELGKVDGATADLGSAYDNASTKIEKFRRQALQKLTVFVGDEVLPKLEGIGRWLSRNPAAFKALAGVVTGVLTAAFVGWAAKTVSSAARATASVARGAGKIVTSGARMAASAGRAAASFARLGARGVAQFGRLGAAAGRAAGRVVAAGARMAASAARATARVVAQIGIQIARWVVLGVQAMLHAAKVAAAWLIAMGPIALVIAAVVGLVALIIANWGTIWATTKRVFNAVWNFLKGLWDKIWATVSGAIGRIKDLFLRFHPLGIIISNWGAITGWVRRQLDRIVGFVTGLPGRISSAASGMFDGISDAFAGSLNSLIGMWNRLRIPGFSFSQSLPGPVPDISFSWAGLELPNIPYLAEGGVVQAPTMAMVGEGGQDEAVVPLSSFWSTLSSGFRGVAEAASTRPVVAATSAGTDRTVAALAPLHSIAGKLGGLDQVRDAVSVVASRTAVAVRDATTRLLKWFGERVAAPLRMIERFLDWTKNGIETLIRIERVGARNVRVFEDLASVGRGHRMFARGGVARHRPGGMLATIAEREDEAVLPLSRLQTMFDAAQMRALRSTPSAPEPAGAVVRIVPEAGDDQFARMLQSWIRTNGGGDVQVALGQQ